MAKIELNIKMIVANFVALVCMWQLDCAFSKGFENRETIDYRAPTQQVASSIWNKYVSIVDKDFQSMSAAVIGSTFDVEFIPISVTNAVKSPSGFSLTAGLNWYFDAWLISNKAHTEFGIDFRGDKSGGLEYWPCLAASKYIKELNCLGWETVGTSLGAHGAFKTYRLEKVGKKLEIKVSQNDCVWEARAVVGNNS